MEINGFSKEPNLDDMIGIKYIPVPASQPIVVEIEWSGMRMHYSWGTDVKMAEEEILAASKSKVYINGLKDSKQAKQRRPVEQHRWWRIVV